MYKTRVEICWRRPENSEKETKLYFSLKQTNLTMKCMLFAI